MLYLKVSSLMQEFDHEIDVQGLLCPLPVLKARKRLLSLKHGETLRILATDPASAIDFPHYCAESGNELITHYEEAGLFVFIIRKNHAK